MNVSIVGGWFPVVFEAVTVGVLVLAVDWRSGGWRRQLVIGLPVAAAAAGAVAFIFTVGSLPPARFPWSAYAWGFTVVLAMVAALSPRTTGRWRRAGAVVAVVLCVLTTLGSINRAFGTFPTIGRLVTDDPEDVVDLPQLEAIRAHVAATGVLPVEGTVITVTIPPRVSHFSTRPAYVYLPPAWFAKVTPSLPTLILLPGEPGGAADWTSYGDADNTADVFARAHHGVAPIIVMPDTAGFDTVDTECVNSRFGNAETYLTDDLPTFAQQMLHASSAPGATAIAGLSAGGTCSIMLALRHPAEFRTFATFSGFAFPQYEETTRAATIDTLFGGSTTDFYAHDPARLLSGGRFDGVAGWFEVGDQDTGAVAAAHALQPAALKAGIATCILVRPGGHDFDLWSQALEDSFPWLCWRLGLIPEPHSEPATCVTP